MRLCGPPGELQRGLDGKYIADGQRWANIESSPVADIFFKINEVCCDQSLLNHIVSNTFPG